MASKSVTPDRYIGSDSTPATLESSNASSRWSSRGVIVKHDPPTALSDYALLPVGRRHFAFVDYDVYEWAISYHWRLVKSSHCSYVVRRITLEGHTLTLRLHVDIMNPPNGYEVHHVDRNPLNCLRSNLVNATPSEHRQLHGKAR